MATPLDRMRAAWLSAGRLALHQEAEELAREGATREALEAAVDALLAEARAAGADEDAEEDILGVGDRLTGWCHAARRIATRERPPEPAAHRPANGAARPDRPVSPA